MRARRPAKPPGPVWQQATTGHGATRLRRCASRFTAFGSFANCHFSGFPDPVRASTAARIVAA